MYSNHPVTIDAINGYLMPLALIMDYVTPEVGFDFFFREVPCESRHQSLDDAVRSVVRTSFFKFNELNRREAFTERQVAELVGQRFSLVRLEDWENALPGRISRWVNDPIVAALTAACPDSPWQRTCLVEDFADMLLRFFGDSPAECWEFGGEIKQELYGSHWGCLDFDDLFFVSGEPFFHLHFDLSD